MNNLKEIQQIQSLIAKGKDSGFLTFDEVTKALPVEMNTRFEEIIGIFEELEIVIVDSEKEGKKIAATPTEVDDDEVGNLDLVEDEESADYSSRSTDPVRMYLREMGAVPLLDRDGEVVIAKKIELGEQDVLYALVEVPVAVEELINVGEDLRQNRIKLKDVVKTIEEDDPSEDEMNQRSRVILLLDEIKAVYKKKRKIYKKLDDCNTLERRVTSTQKEIISYKEEIVTRLRDIKLEKTLIDRIIENGGGLRPPDAQLPARPFRLHPLHRPHPAGDSGHVRRSGKARSQSQRRRARSRPFGGRAFLLQGDDPRQDRDPQAPAGKMLP